jgi:hypothetical protein
MSRRLLVSIFENEHDILGATISAREQGYEIVDAYTPFAVHNLIGRGRVAVEGRDVYIDGTLMPDGWQVDEFGYSDKI